MSNPWSLHETVLGPDGRRTPPRLEKSFLPLARSHYSLVGDKLCLEVRPQKDRRIRILEAPAMGLLKAL